MNCRRHCGANWKRFYGASHFFIDDAEEVLSFLTLFPLFFLSFSLFLKKVRFTLSFFSSFCQFKVHDRKWQRSLKRINAEESTNKKEADE